MTCIIYSISKKNPLYASLFKRHQQACLQFKTKLEIVDISVSKESKEHYSKAFNPYLKPNSYAMHPTGKLYDSLQFSQLLSTHARVQFFIAGAYGFEKTFLDKLIPLSLSPLTLSASLAKLVLCEQIFRGLSLLNKHPYHK
ncbi:23S rRNA (pseudouridine(1915)-N(3))-methyltransferase RlmH [Helicobacter suis]|uniref:23S rRNA (pseudouridine(1915)-N(3))-methyltransferase RlmH n=1 Tax=Helicobacter suis TaxID=104628 RepID=UPI0013D2972E|nr:23S rRNA (pseudouridine(1915)-N(3))-methyltransferase RlmH [Helicobacter suis]